MSQREFGQFVGIDASYICNAEKNGHLYASHRRRIAEKLGLDDDGANLLEDVAEKRAVV